MNKFLQMDQTITTAVDEFDYNENLKPSAVLQYFQDLATSHAIELGIGFEEMKRLNLCWVLSRLSAEIISLPKIGDRITVTTFPRKPNLVDAVRDYFVYDAKGHILIRGTSKWCVLDFQNRAIRRCSPLFHFKEEQYKSDDEFVNGNPQLASLSDVQGTLDGPYENEVKMMELDRNRHMNNARYGDVIMNAIPMNFLDSHILKRFDINFLSELLPQQEYLLFKKQLNTCSYFEATKNSTEVVFRAKLEWDKL